MQQRLGRFEILKRLGQGAMGEVYLGFDPAIGREVAIKTIHREASQGAEARERFAREARAAGTLNHPNLVTIHEFGEDQGLLYLAMEYVPGVDLEAMFRDRVLPPVEALEVLAQVCDGLAYAHKAGVLHRDIKPSNIRVRREGDRLHAKVMDFGIARIAGSDMTGTGTLLGTFGYMAPEYIKTGVPDARCDVFAVGVMLYEALAGYRPFAGDTTATVLYRVVNEDPPALSAEHLRGISPQTGALLAKALAKDPFQRFHTAEALAHALREARDPAWPGLPGSQPTRAIARDTRSSAKAAAPARPRRSWSWVAALLTLSAGGVGAWTWYHRPAPPRLISLPASDGGQAPATEARVPDREGGPKPEPLRKTRSATYGAPEPSATASRPQVPEPEAAELLNEAAKGLVDQPQASLGLCERVLRDHPTNTRAYALKVVALYALARYQDIPGVLEAGKEQGVRPAQYLAFGAFQAMLREERRERRLPREVREALQAERPARGLRPGPAQWSRRP